MSQKAKVSNSNIMDDAVLPARKIWERYGVCSRTLDRWLADERLAFPIPVVVNRRRYFRQSEIEAWERARATSRSGGGLHGVA